MANTSGEYLAANATAATFTVTAPAYSTPTGTGAGARIYEFGFGVINPPLVYSYANQLVAGTHATLYRGESSFLWLFVQNVSGAASPLRGTIWADMNDDGDFSDSDEERLTAIEDATTSEPNRSTIPNNFYVHNSSGSGAVVPINYPGTTMRVRVIGRLGSTSPQPNDTGYAGDYLDFTIAIAANTAPTLNTSLTATLPNMVSSDTDSVGISTAALIDSPGDLITDPDPASSNYEGLALIGASGNGTWQYLAQPEDTSWQTISNLSETNTFLVPRGRARLRFVPSGTGSYSLVFRAWDRTEGDSFQYYNIAAGGGTGGTNAFSTQTMTATGTVVDPATGGTSSLYLVNAEMGSIHAAALDAATGTILPPRMVYRNYAVVAGFPDRLVYDSAHDYFYFKQSFVNLHRVKSDGTGYEALTQIDPSNGYVATMDLNPARTALRYVVNDYNTGSNSVYGASLSAPASASLLGIQSQSDAPDQMAWDGTNLFFGAFSLHKIFKTDSSGGNEGDLITLTVNNYATALEPVGSALVWAYSTNGPQTRVMSIPISGGTATQMATFSASQSYGVKVDSTHGFAYVLLDDPKTLYRMDYPSGANITKLLDLPDFYTALDLRIATPAADTTPPTVVSVKRKTPAQQTVNTPSVMFEVTFSEAVQNVSTSSFAVTAVGVNSTIVGSVSSVTGGPAVYNVAVNITSGRGEFRLDVLNP